MRRCKKRPKRCETKSRSLVRGWNANRLEVFLATGAKKSLESDERALQNAVRADCYPNSQEEEGDSTRELVAREGRVGWGAKN